jgi:hypothetical protein
MTDTPAAATDVMPSATIAGEAELTARNALSRNEQISRYRDVLANSSCDRIADASMSDILTAARQRVAARRHG